MAIFQKYYASHFYNLVCHACCSYSVTTNERNMVAENFHVKLHSPISDEAPFYYKVFPGYKNWMCTEYFSCSNDLVSWEKQIKKNASRIFKKGDNKLSCFMFLSFIDYVDIAFDEYDNSSVLYEYENDKKRLTETGLVIVRAYLNALKFLHNAFPERSYSEIINGCSSAYNHGIWYR